MDNSASTANGGNNSLIFQHLVSGIDSYWWFDGTQFFFHLKWISDSSIKLIFNLETINQNIITVKPSAIWY